MAPLSRPGQTWLIRYSSIEISPAALSIHGSRNHHKTRWKSATLGGRHCTIHRVPRSGASNERVRSVERGENCVSASPWRGESLWKPLLLSFHPSVSSKRIGADFEGKQLLLSTSPPCDNEDRTFRKIVLFGDSYEVERSCFSFLG